MIIIIYNRDLTTTILKLVQTEVLISEGLKTKIK